MKLCIYAVQLTDSFEMAEDIALAVLHDSRNTVVIIGRHVVVGGGFFFGLCQFRLLPAHGGEFRFYPEMCIRDREVLIFFTT